MNSTTTKDIRTVALVSWGDAVPDAGMLTVTVPSAVNDGCATRIRSREQLSFWRYSFGQKFPKILLTQGKPGCFTILKTA